MKATQLKRNMKATQRSVRGSHEGCTEVKLREVRGHMKATQRSNSRKLERLMKAARQDNTIRASAAAQKLLNNVSTNSTTAATAASSGADPSAFGTEFGGSPNAASDMQVSFDAIFLSADLSSHVL